jgi:hypothetical protein
MRLAFHKTCKALQLSDKDDAFTDIVATIVELAKTGERNPDRLCSQVLDGAGKVVEFSAKWTIAFWHPYHPVGS